MLVRFSERGQPVFHGQGSGDVAGWQSKVATVLLLNCSPCFSFDPPIWPGPIQRGDLLVKCASSCRNGVFSHMSDEVMVKI